jgi:hypothetical protein
VPKLKKPEIVNMKRITATLFLILLFAIAAVSFNCGQRDEVRSEAYVALAEMNKAAVSNFDVEIAKIDQQQRDNQVSRVKLEQVLVPALKWVEDKKVSIDINSIPCG